MNIARQSSDRISIRRTLQLWLLGGVTLCTLGTGILTYTVMRDESNELFDRQLRQLVVTVPHDFTAPIPTVPDGEAEDDIVVQVWNAAGDLLYVAPRGSVLPRSVKVGFSEMVFREQHWRVYAQFHKGNYVQAAQPVATRDELAGQMALGATAPFLLLIPALLILIWFVIRRGLQPLNQVTNAVTSRSADDLQPIAVRHAPTEIRPLLDALNDLLTRLEKAWSAQRAFVADAAHELRSPLTALKLQLQRAEKTTDPELRAIAYHKLQERLDRTVHVVQQLLTLARQEPQGTQSPTVTEADVAAVAAASVAQFAPLAEAKQIDLGLDSPAGPIRVRIAPDSLRILIDNLIDNAIRYTPNGGRVAVSIQRVHDVTTLNVSDNGPGIPQEDRERVFDRFYRREDSGEMGSGLGLAIVKAIADKAHATIRLGQLEEKGTLVQVTFQ
ncbi:MAG: HAMP domain-containing protein [Gammaproteobacteria bacterium]|nr:HAMP domain-containing protein [Gammaproteobacteria bacterium]